MPCHLSKINKKKDRARVAIAGTARPMKTACRLFLTALFLAALILFGIGTKFYQGRFEGWVHNYAGGIIYEVFWILVFGALFRKARAWRIALSVFIVTCVLETLQLYRPAFLETIRSAFIGRALIGHGFDPWDFPHYLIGSLIGWRGCPLMRRCTSLDRPQTYQRSL